MRESFRLAGPVLVLAVAVAGGVLATGADTFPMDDAYIHAVYARNLAETGQLTFNLNPPDHGIGTTSILWPLLLAALHPVLDVVPAARVLGITAYLAMAWLVTIILGWMTPADDRRTIWLSAALVVLSGNLIWFSLSGMETMLWLSLGLGAVVAYRHRRWPLLGVLLGLMLLTRIEAVVLLAAIVGVELWADRKLSRGVLLASGLAMLLLAPWLAFVHAKTGHFLPTSYEGKKHAQIRGAVSTVEEVMGGGDETVELEETDLPAWTALIYPLGAGAYMFAFVAGGMYLPGWRFPLGEGQLSALTGGLSFTAVILLLGLLGPVMWKAVRRAGQLVRRPRFEDHQQRALLVLLGWFVLHNLAYWIKLPTPGTASRYQVVNHVAWWLLLGAGVWRFRPQRERCWQVAWVLLFLAGWNTFYWRQVYAADVRHMRDVRLAAAEYVRTELPPEAVIAAHDIGALGWRMDHRCIDMGGLIDPGWLEAAKAGRQADYLDEHHVRYVVLPTKHSTEAAGFFDYAEFLGLEDNPQIDLVALKHFENDHADWAFGAAPTWNAVAGVTIFEYHRREP